MSFSVAIGFFIFVSVPLCSLVILEGIESLVGSRAFHLLVLVFGGLFGTATISKEILDWLLFNPLLVAFLGPSPFHP